MACWAFWNIFTVQYVLNGITWQTACKNGWFFNEILSLYAVVSENPYSRNEFSLMLQTFAHFQFSLISLTWHSTPWRSEGAGKLFLRTHQAPLNSLTMPGNREQSVGASFSMFRQLLFCNWGLYISTVIVFYKFFFAIFPIVCSWAGVNFSRMSVIYTFAHAACIGAGAQLNVLLAAHLTASLRCASAGGKTP